jgi:transcriptional regulator of acetoin/glycerol metabolism
MSTNLELDRTVSDSEAAHGRLSHGADEGRQSPESLRQALDRITSLEAQLERLQAERALTTAFTDMRLRDVECTLVKNAMSRFNGNISRASRALGLSRSALYRRLERHKLAIN